MAFAFLPSHPIHGQVATHNQNLRQAHSNAVAFTQSQYYMHDAAHSIQDLSNRPLVNPVVQGPANFIDTQGELPVSGLLGTGYSGTSELEQTDLSGSNNASPNDATGPDPHAPASRPGMVETRAGSQLY
jgi:hypothetical protein